MENFSLHNSGKILIFNVQYWTKSIMAGATQPTCNSNPYSEGLALGEVLVLFILCYRASSVLLLVFGDLDLGSLTGY